ncbi:kinase-like domain-containing protein [Mycena galopus ATCC 62051]|nr:kinase-like domain-containing protein [Mycena galopus ATCC 62051]
MTALERLKAMYFVLTCSHKESGRHDTASLLHLGFSEFPTGFKSLFVKLLNDGKQSMENGSGSTHTTSRGIYQHMNLCLSVAVVGLVLVLQDCDSYCKFLTYRGPDAQRLLDSLQDFLDLDSFSVVKPLICKALLRLSRASRLYPRCFTLTGLQKVGQQVDGRGFGDIWKGLVHGHSVCVKIMRIFQNDCVEDVLKKFSPEALIWRQLCHPNLLPFFGLYYHDLDNRLCLVSLWMENGNVVAFLRKHPLDVDHLSLILDVALGLEYLHERKVVHGDLKGINILITPLRRACIADFGLSSIVNAMTVQLTSTAPTQGGTARYQAPKLFKFASDVYGFACVCYEILTGRVPFYELPNDMAVMFSLLQNCWGGQAENRPTAPQIVQRLDHKFTSKFRRLLQAQPLPPSTQIEAHKESFPDQGSAAPQNTEDSPERGRRSLKRPSQEKTAGPSSDDDSGTGSPTAKRWKPSLEVMDFALED